MTRARCAQETELYDILSAGPRRFKLPVTVGELMIAGDRVDARIIQLGV